MINYELLIMIETITQNYYYNKGIKNDIAFVFSVPGKLELYNNRPVVGETGVLLEDLMFLLKDEIFKDIDKNKRTNRYDYRITNSFNQPTFKAKDNRTEASKTEIEEKNNIERLRNELIDITNYIFVFGDKAKIAIENLKGLKAKLIFVRHLGLMSVNQIKKDIDNNELIPNEKGNTFKRLKVIAKNIKEQIKNTHNS